MAKKYKAKNRTKKIVAGIVAGVLAIAALAGIIALFRPNTKDETIEINPKFTTGALSATTGKYTETEASLYTKDVFDATGLQVEVDFDATVSYQLFYYDEDGAFLAASAVLTENHTAVLPEGTDGARMVITPDWTDVDEDEQVIAWYDVNKYVDQLKLTITNPDYVEEETEDEKETATKTTQFTKAFCRPASTNDVDLSQSELPCGTYVYSDTHFSTEVMSVGDATKIRVSIDMSCNSNFENLANSDTTKIDCRLIFYTGSDIVGGEGSLGDNTWDYDAANNTYVQEKEITYFTYDTENIQYVVCCIPAGYIYHATVELLP